MPGRKMPKVQALVFVIKQINRADIHMHMARDQLHNCLQIGVDILAPSEHGV